MRTIKINTKNVKPGSAQHSKLYGDAYFCHEGDSVDRMLWLFNNMLIERDLELVKIDDGNPDEIVLRIEEAK